MKKELAEFLFTKLNSSYETAYKVVGLDIENEKQLREKENTDLIEETFFPRINAFTVSGKTEDDKNGRPKDDKSNDPIKQQQDEVRNKSK